MSVLEQFTAIVESENILPKRIKIRKVEHIRTFALLVQTGTIYACFIAQWLQLFTEIM